MRRTVRRPTPAWEVRIFQAGGCSLFFVMLRHVKKVKARLRDPASWLLLRVELTQPSLPLFYMSVYAQQKCRTESDLGGALSHFYFFRPPRRRFMKPWTTKVQVEKARGREKKIFSRVDAVQKVKSEAGTLRVYDVAKRTTFKRERRIMNSRGRGQSQSRQALG